MTEISVVAQEIAASRQRGVLADEGKLWEKLRLDAERVAAGEEMLRGFLDLIARVQAFGLNTVVEAGFSMLSGQRPRLAPNPHLRRG
jgi:hypothetical protein